MLAAQTTPTGIYPFFVALNTRLTDPRYNRGKRHNLAFILSGVVLAIMSGRAKASSIHRYIENRIVWLRRITRQEEAKPISRAHLPRILAIVDWEEFNDLSESHFGIRIEPTKDNEWKKAYSLAFDLSIRQRHSA